MDLKFTHSWGGGRRKESLLNSSMSHLMFLITTILGGTLQLYLIEVHFYFFSLFFWREPRRAECGILVPQPGMEPEPPALEVPLLNHWTAREVRRRFISKYPTNDAFMAHTESIKQSPEAQDSSATKLKDQHVQHHPDCQQS